MHENTFATDPGLARVIAARHHDPFSFLGRHSDGKDDVIRLFIPAAKSVALPEIDQTLIKKHPAGLFEWRGNAQLPKHYRISWIDQAGVSHTSYDPYSFGPVTSSYDLYLFGQGRHYQAWKFLGARILTISGIAGVLFTTWAPNAESVSVTGDFNNWDSRHMMRSLGASGVWELFVPGELAGSLYKFEICHNNRVESKCDPYALQFELRPDNASKITGTSTFEWHDSQWLDQRSDADWLHGPVSIYEVHAGSWQRDGDGTFLNYRELAARLIPYVKQLGFTHIELLPVSEHPLDASWGYQTTGYFAPTSRHGTPDDLRHFVDECHQNDLGVILDWVPGHFPRDTHALAQFDGTGLYEHADPRMGEHREWGTLVFNYDRNEVRCFLLSSAIFWLQELHMDGLRIDAVASMLYLDYSRKDGEWLANKYGGRENLAAIDFLRELNHLTHTQVPGTFTCAEESTSWPMVSRPGYVGGLGFSMKWNMGWMHDSLQYMNKEPVYRHYHHDNLTFGLLYAFSENFVLPFSHDEVVHQKRSMIEKMPGDEWQKFANLRTLYTYQFTYPGKKLLFMGSEFAQKREWDFNKALDWEDTAHPLNEGIMRLVSDLNHLYVTSRALHVEDFDERGFEWVDCHDASQSVLSYMRKGDGGLIVVILNFTPVPRHNYRIGVPEPGYYRERLNSDAKCYGGSDVGNGGGVESEPISWMGQRFSLNLCLPPLGGLILEPAD